MALTVVALLRTAPAQTLLLGVLPLVLAGLQLLNALVNGLAIVPATGFAAVMVGFAAVATGHLAAVCRIERLERGLDVAQ